VVASGSSSTLQQAAEAVAVTVTVEVAVPAALCSSPSVLSTGSGVNCEAAGDPTAQNQATTQNASSYAVDLVAVAPASTESVTAAVAAADAMQLGSSHQDVEKQTAVQLQCDHGSDAAAESVTGAAAVTSANGLSKSDDAIVHGSSDSNLTAAPREEGLVHVRPSDWQHAESLAREQELLRRQTHSVNAAAAAAAVVVLDTQVHQLRQSSA
jgi:hypothetical protein